MDLARRRELSISDDLELSPGTYHLFYRAGDLLVELTANPNFYQKIEDQIATDSGLAVVVNGLAITQLLTIPSGALVAVRLRVPGNSDDIEQQASPLLLGLVILAITTVATFGALQLKRLEKDVIESIPDEAIVNTSRGVFALGLGALIAALGGLYVVLRE